MKKKIAAIVIAYHPQADELEKNMLAYMDAVDLVLVWRNSPEALPFLEKYPQKVVPMGDGTNKYMAYPLNVALDWCKQNGYDYLMAMDQDSLWSDCGAFVNAAMSMAETDVALFAPNVNHLYDDKESYDTERAITSGSLYNVEVVTRLGGFRENYQIYWVDDEFCYWARLNGYKIKLLGKYNLQQQFGKETVTAFGFTTSNYSPKVYYFLHRNMMWMKREYGEVPSLRCILYIFFYCVRGILLGEKNKLRKLAAIGTALLHGLFSPLEKRKNEEA